MNLLLFSILSSTLMLAFGQAIHLTELSSFTVPDVGGVQKRFSHVSNETKSIMKFAIYLPPAVSSRNGLEKANVLYFLEGAHCDETAIWRSRFWSHAAKYNLIIVTPDTSPRGLYLPDEDRRDVGEGLGWYLDATTNFWKDHYRMHSYVTKELPELIETEFKDVVIRGRKSIMGHSMGGYGALMVALRNPGLYVSASASAPALSPTDKFRIPCYREYLGPDTNAWKEWDATYLVGNYKGPDLHLLVDQGTADTNVRPEDSKEFREAAKNASIPINFRFQEGFDHFNIVSKVIGEHFKHHADFLRQ